MYIAQFDMNGILTALYIVLYCKQMYYMHVCININEHSYSYTYTGLLT